jgi:DNA-binding transcriptional regulator YbjK
MIINKQKAKESRCINMHEGIILYKNLTSEMINAIQTREDFQEYIAILLDRRQAILDDFKDKGELARFRKMYDAYEINVLDEELKELLTQELNQTKSDILEQKKKRVANNAYSKVSRDGLNIFNAKI